MRRSKAILWAFLFVALAAPVRAQTTFKFVNPGTVTAYGYYVGPYNGLMGEGLTQSVLLNCVDFFHHVAGGQIWTANLTSLGGTDLTNTRFGGMANALDLYRQAAWLTTQYQGQTNSEFGQIQATIWQLFGGMSTPAPNTNYWLTQAQLNFQTLDYSNFAVVTDVNKFKANSVQEFLIYQPTVTPEPATMMLLGTGLAGLIPMARRRLRKKSQEDGDNLA